MTDDGMIRTTYRRMPTLKLRGYLKAFEDGRAHFSEQELRILSEVLHERGKLPKKHEVSDVAH